MKGMHRTHDKNNISERVTLTPTSQQELSRSVFVQQSLDPEVVVKREIVEEDIWSGAVQTENMQGQCPDKGSTAETSLGGVQLWQVKKEPSESEYPGSTYHHDLDAHKETVEMDNNPIYKWTVAPSVTVPLKVDDGTVETNRTETEAAGRVSTEVQQKVSNKETFGSEKVLVFILNRPKPSNSVVKTKLEVETMVKKAQMALKYKNLKEDLKNNWSFLYNCTLLKSNENCIEYLKFYHGEATTIQLSVKIRSDFTPLIQVHGKNVSPEHEFWFGLPEKYTTPADIVKLLTRLRWFTVCMGNPDKEYQSLIKSHVESRQPPHAYVEGDFGAVKDGVSYTSSIRSIACELLTKYERCRKCLLYRNTLINAKTRETKDIQNAPSDLLTSKKPHSQMNCQVLKAKLQEALEQAKVLAVANQQLRQQMTRNDNVLKKPGSVTILTKSGARTIATSLMTGGELNMGTNLSTEESGHVPQLNDFTIVTESNDQDTPAHREEGSKDGTTIMVVPTEMSKNMDIQAEIGSQGGGPHEGLVLKAMNGGAKMNSLLRENDADFTKKHVLEKTALNLVRNTDNSSASQIGEHHEDEKPIQSYETAEMFDDSHSVAAPKNPHLDLGRSLPSLVLHCESHQSTDMHDCKECGKAFPRLQDLKKHARTHQARKTFKCRRCWKIFPSQSILVAHRKVHAAEKHVKCDKKCDKCGKVFSNAIQLRSHVIREHWDDHQFKCNKCDKVFSQYPSLALHRRTHKVEKPFKCCICNWAFTTNNALTAHMKTHTGERPYKCTQCSKAYSSSESLKKHSYRIHTGENSCKCKLCGKTYSSFSSLHAHLMIHSGEKPYKCEYCDVRCYTASALSGHRKTHTGEKPYKCNICPKTFLRLGNLKIHRVIHTGEKPYKCKLCNKAFNTSTSLTRHQKVHSGEKPHQCEQCGKSFAESTKLRGHLMLHNGEKPKRYGKSKSKSKSFKCEICEKEFAHTGHYKIHMRNHTGERPYQCQECGKSFNQKGSLNTHMMTHTGEKPFQCNLCEKAFIYKLSLKQHALTHSGEKPHTCEQCGLAFALKSYLVSHQRTHTGEKPFQCEQCGKAFAQSAHLKGHIKTNKSRSSNAGSQTKTD